MEGSESPLIDGSRKSQTPSSEPPRALSRAEIVELLEATLVNSRSLAESAHLLLDRGRLEHAYALAELGVEEFGKLQLLSRFAIDVTLGGRRPDWTAFWKKFRNHEDKASNATFLDHVLSNDLQAWAAGDAEGLLANQEGITAAAREARTMVEMRERALYVDMGSDGILRPDDPVVSANARMIVEGLEGLLDLVERYGLAGTPERFEKMARSKEFRARAESLRKVVGKLRPIEVRLDDHELRQGRLPTSP